MFSVLLLLGGDVVNRALAQLAGAKGWKGRIVPVGFSFGEMFHCLLFVLREGQRGEEYGEEWSDLLGVCCDMKDTRHARMTRLTR